MKIKLINNINSKEFNDTVELGDANSKTLGFLPRAAFENYAQNNKIIGAFDNEMTELSGYLLYRTANDKVTIVHLCINDKYRKKGVAHKLIEYLKSHTKRYKGIRLSCRNDYNINYVWEKFNFIPIKEKPGRSKEGKLLTEWWYPHNKEDLFSQITEYELQNKISAVIDMNIFLDLKENREKESMALQNDWLLDEINLYITREIFVEINRNSDANKKEQSRNFASTFKQLPFYEKKYTEILKKLNAKIQIQNSNDQSDLKHIAYAISGEAEYFITRDNLIVENSNIFSEFGINIYKPSQFITRLDELLHTSKYKPQNLIGTSISKTNITSDNTERVITKFLSKNNERKSQLTEKIKVFQAQPQIYELLTISKNADIIAFIVYDRSNKDSLKIPIFRFSLNNLKETLSKHLLYKIIFTATQEDRTFIEITEEYLDDVVADVIKQTRFVRYKNKWVKINLKYSLSKQETLSKLNSLTNDVDFVDKIKLNTENVISTEENNNPFYYNLERTLFPLKISNLQLPCFIIPIQPHWAEALFGDQLNLKLPLFDPDYQLLLNRENVYYRSHRPNILKSPARILWWVSENRQTKQKGAIRACSYIDAVFVDKRKPLFKRFKKLGIYKWEQIVATGRNNDEIMAFIFSDTELFTNLISSTYAKEYIKKQENKNFMIASPLEIKEKTYIDFYEKGMQL